MATSMDVPVARIKIVEKDKCVKGPWRNLERYRMDRLKEARYEAELAEDFLRNGLVRNAAGKAFQAVKAYLAAEAAARRDVLAGKFAGVRVTRHGKRVARVDWIIAVMPTSRMKEVAQLLGDRELELAVEKALDLHEFQYNGLDREGDVSRYVDVASVGRDVMGVARFIRGRTT